MSAEELAGLRRDYQRGGLDESDLAATPAAMAQRWLDEAMAAGVHEPNAMVVATVSADGQPSSRTVLLKGLDERGFVFFTNHDSRKGAELADNARCALLFPWYTLERQIRVEGAAAPLDRAEVTAYFSRRPRGSQLGAWASPQSQVVAGRAELDERYAAVVERFGDESLEPPPRWGGYRVAPTSVEFWQGRSGRMHDRLRYRLVDDDWVTERLAP